MRALTALLVTVVISGCFAAPVQVDQLDDLKEKLKSLHDVLDNLSEKIDDLENKDEREFAPIPPEQPADQELSDFVNGLSEEDKEIVNKMKSKMKFLQATVHEEPGVDIPAADGFEQEHPLKREMDEDLQNLFNGLSEEDQKLLKAHPSVWGHLDKALKTPGGDPNDAVAGGGVEKKAYEEELQSFVNKLSKDDQELLNRMKSKLQNLKIALKQENEEGNFGDFVSENEARNVNVEGHWGKKAAECEGKDCNQQQLVNEVERRLLDDVRYAKDNGVSLKQVLRVLMQARLKA